MQNLFFKLVRDINHKLIHVVIPLHQREFRQRIDQYSGLFDFAQTAPTGQAFLAIVAAGGFAFARVESTQAGLPSVSKISMVVSPSMSVISAALNLPLLW